MNKIKNVFVALIIIAILGLNIIVPVSNAAEANIPSKTVENGTYVITSALASNMVLDISGGSKLDRANLQIWENANVLQQKFVINRLENGYYKIEAKHSKKTLDVLNANKTDGTNVWQFESNGTAAQQWLIKDVGNGYYSFVSKCNGLYLDVDGARKLNGTNVQMYTGNGTNAQKFKLVKQEELVAKKTIESGTYKISTALANNKVLDISQASKLNTANVQIWENVGEPQQRFEITYLDNGYYKIAALHSGKVLDVANADIANGTNVWQFESNGTAAQQWIIKDVGNGYYSFISKCNELYLDINEAKTSNGTNVQMYAGNGTNAQKFKIQAYNVGIDVSTYQKQIDWGKVKADGVQFAMIRAGLRGYGTSDDGVNGKIVEDSYFKTNITGAISKGIEVGVYFFTQAINEQEAIEEANYTLKLVKDYKITYPIAIDTEASSHPNGQGRADNLSVEARTKVVAAFCKTIEEAGYEPMIYASKSWFKDKLDMSKLSDYSVWLAHYTGATQNDPLAKPSDYEGKYIMWQYTSQGTVDGILGNVDMNVGFGRSTKKLQIMY